MKKLTALTLTALTIIILLLAACGNRNHLEIVEPAEEIDMALVGLWRWDGMTIWRYIFNEDGTGERGINGVQIEQFTWSTVSNITLNINIVSELLFEEQLRYERWAYRIRGNQLTLESLQDETMIYTYFR